MQPICATHSFHHSLGLLSVFPHSLSNCLLFSVCPVPESLYDYSFSHSPLYHTQRAWVHSSFEAIHKKQRCVNQALPPVPSTPRVHPPESDSRDIDQKLVRHDEQWSRVGGQWCEWGHELRTFSFLSAHFPFLESVIFRTVPLSRF